MCVCTYLSIISIYIYLYLSIYLYKHIDMHIPARADAVLEVQALRQAHQA